MATEEKSVIRTSHRPRYALRSASFGTTIAVVSSRPATAVWSWALKTSVPPCEETIALISAMSDAPPGSDEDRSRNVGK